ncbi:hypothetical protein ACERK3_10155 [Phycisphaerales bacterium AB-hyl4]|uniref:Flagellar protein FliL n=1 Tax=Natronomicrosphaera hydrolytica TaxID=3242702 RepID=A0ABV4U8P9_9BACT
MPETEAKTEESPKGGFSLKTVLVLVAILALEAAAISAVFLLSGGPEDARAAGAAEDEAALAEQPVEVLVIADKFQNTRTGRSYLYDTEVYIVTQRRWRGSVEQRIDSMEAQLTSDVATIFRRAEPAHLLEPELATLTRQLEAAMNRRLGKDEEGEPLVQEVLIRKLMRFRGDL